MPIDPALLKELETRRAKADLGGGKDKLAKRREKGQLTARDRLEALFDRGTFIEFGKHAAHACHAFGMQDKEMPADGVVTGIGYVAGRAVAAYSHDFTVGGGALGRIHARKVCDLMDYAMTAGIPIVGVNDSGGARIQEGVDSLSGYGQIFFRNVQASGLVPQIALIAGPCAGGAAYSPALTDFLIMVRNEATNMFICGPQVIKAATGEDAKLEQFATADAHAAVGGNVHLIANDDRHAVELAKTLMSYLPSNNLDDPPHHPTEQVSLEAKPRLNQLMPADPKAAFEVRDMIAEIVDADSFFEIMASFAPNLVVGFARIDGVVVGVVANQPKVKAGCLDIDASDKGARFIRTCNVYGIPLVTLVDVPGYMPGLAQERGGIIRHGAKMLFAYASATVPKITVILRKAYGGAYLAMCSSDLGADLVFAWPTAEIAVMGAEGAVKVVFGKELKESADPKGKLAELISQYREEFASPYQAAKNALITDVIEPAQTRSMVSLGLRSLLSKRETRPPKKHGNIPL
ncbi:acyl-CoA carboxylase subunit beta [Opitutales bacterium ASA1]|uniref:acyl-CoA carboxylase subunit beta n=1 Tax=Congregicoccus parvus TaxID=3081749 RepID=UPI002B2C1E54|nr:acyl-CoA carboxylase subunit beta [Opitutales bacterium ASA1]